MHKLIDYSDIPKSDHIIRPFYCRNIEEISAYIKRIQTVYEEPFNPLTYSIGLPF
jgi:hypothetical protein